MQHTAQMRKAKSYDILHSGGIHLDYLNENVSINLRKIRKRKQMSLDNVAIETGISKSMLGQIERGETNPTLATLGKITSGLRVNFMELISSPLDESYLIRKQSITPAKEEKGHYQAYTYFPYEQDRNFEIYSICVQPGCIYPCVSHGEQTMEYLIVEEGRLLLNLGDEDFPLSQGDAIRFQSDRSHSYKNPGDALLRFLVVFTWRKA